MVAESLMQRIRVNCKDLLQGLHAKPSLLDSVVTSQDQLRHCVRACIQAVEPVRDLERVPTLRLAEAVVGNGRPDTMEEHCVSTCRPHQWFWCIQGHRI